MLRHRPRYRFRRDGALRYGPRAHHHLPVLPHARADWRRVEPLQAPRRLFLFLRPPRFGGEPGAPDHGCSVARRFPPH